MQEMKILDSLVISGAIGVRDIIATGAETQGEILIRLTEDKPELKNLAFETIENAIVGIKPESKLSRELKLEKISEIRELLDILEEQIRCEEDVEQGIIETIPPSTTVSVC